MSLLRRAFVIGLIGLIIGVASGVGFAYWRRLTRGSVVATTTPDQTLTLRCTGGLAPEIIVTWPAKLTSVMDGLERSVDADAWQKVFSSGSTPKVTGYTDRAVALDRDYHYRVRVLPTGPYATVSIHTDQATCTSTP